jgi:NAD-dependent deacetylase
MTGEERIEQFAGLVRDSRNIVFFGGAGVSTESGMKDYRSEDGLYNTVRHDKVAPETILSRSFFYQHPDVFYDFYYHFFLDTSAEPNRAHFALAKLETMGKLRAVVTQNIDGLHQRAGSQNVIELHGTVTKHHCPVCHTFMPAEEIRALEGRVPKCRKCGAVVKPDVVLYEEPLDEEVIRRAVGAISSADLMIVGGTSLAVYPAAGFLRYFGGRAMVLINRDETPYDSMASLVFRERIGEVLSGVMGKI